MKLFEKMNLPNTAGLGIRGFFELPMDIGFAWFPSFNSVGECIYLLYISFIFILYISNNKLLIYFIISHEVITFSPERLVGLRQTRTKILKLLNTLFSAWDPVKIFLFGFSQVIEFSPLLSCLTIFRVL